MMTAHHDVEKKSTSDASPSKILRDMSQPVIPVQLGKCVRTVLPTLPTNPLRRWCDHSRDASNLTKKNPLPLGDGVEMG